MTSTQNPDQAQILDRLRRAALDLRAARGEIAALRAAKTEPIAVIGVGCRFAGGVDSLDDLWSLIRAGGDAVGPFPTDRSWPEIDSSTSLGYFLDDATGFDASFFGVGPHEARAMDPQQRHALEVSWHALEHAGIDPRSLRGTPTSVHLGATSFHYGGDYLNPPEDLAGNLVTGSVTSVVSGRISYLLGLTGPSVTLDTACSSALYAIHLAAASLRSGESSLALAGGVCVMATPGVFSEFTYQNALAPDGRCKSFAADADGTGWGEGAGVVVLERLSDAVQAGRRVLAVIRSSAVNCDGASNGLTAPSASAQRDVIRRALEAGGLDATEVDAVEAHGTGTALGDPIEAAAVQQVYGRPGIRDEPIWMGSVKSNIGHTQAAAGIGSLAKAVKMVGTGIMPRSLHLTEPTPAIDWDAGSLALLREERRWPDVARPRRVGVSGFGVSGTNVHVIVEQAPDSSDPTVDAEAHTCPVGPTHPLVVSARSPEALDALRAGVAAMLDADDPPPLCAVAEALRRRATHEERAVVLADDIAAAATALREGPARTGRAPRHPRPVFVFPGQGSQWAGMCRALLAEDEVFAESFTAAAAAVSRFSDVSVHDGLGTEGSGRVLPVDVIQPTLFAVMTALADTCVARGFAPTAVIGHSQGEIAAAVVAGALSLDDGARVVAVRSAALRAIAGTGGMAAVAADPATVEDIVRQSAADVAIAGLNGPTSVVVSGPVDEVERFAAQCRDQGTRVWIIDVDYASHGPAVDALRDRIVRGIGPLTPMTPTLPWYSTVDGETVGPRPDAAYWFENLRRPVRLHRATQTAHRHGHRVFVEVSPHPVLGVALTSTLDAIDGVGGTRVLETLHRDGGDGADLLDALAGAWCAGLPVELWPAAHGEASGASTVELPVYPFRHRRFWFAPDRGSGGGEAEGPPSEPEVDASELALAVRAGDPALGRRRVVSHVVSAVARALGHDDARSVAADQSFLDLGVGSMAAVALRADLMAATGLALPVTVAFEHPTPEALADHIHTLLRADTTEDTQRRAEAPTAGERSVAEDVDPVAVADLDMLTDDEMFAALDRELGDA